jgi:hypothetical protein
VKSRSEFISTVALAAILGSGCSMQTLAWPTPTVTLQSVQPTSTPTTVLANNWLWASDIENQRKTLTDLQWKIYESTLVGQRFLWNCRVSDVTEGGDVYVRCTSSTWSVVLQGMPRQEAAKLNKGTIIRFEGTLTGFSSLLGASYIYFGNVVMK